MVAKELECKGLAEPLVPHDLCRRHFCHLISRNMWAGDRRKISLLSDLVHHLFLSGCKDLRWKLHWEYPIDAATNICCETRDTIYLPQMQQTRQDSYLLWLRGKRATSISNLPSFKGVFGGIFSLLSCWKALEGSKHLMPCTAHSCSWRCLLVCFSLVSNDRSFETS